MYVSHVISPLGLVAYGKSPENVCHVLPSPEDVRAVCHRYSESSEELASQKEDK